MVSLDSVFASVIKMGVSIVKDKIIEKNKTSSIKETLENYVGDQFASTFQHLNLDNEVDYGGLSDFLLINAFDEMSDYIVGIHIDKKEILLNSIISKAQDYAKADNALKQKLVERYIMNALDIIRNFYINALSDDMKLFIGIVSDNVSYSLKNEINYAFKQNELQQQEILRGLCRVPAVVEDTKCKDDNIDFTLHAGNLISQMHNTGRLDITLDKTVQLNLHERRFGFVSAAQSSRTCNINDIAEQLKSVKHILFDAPSGAGKTVTLRQLCDTLARNVLQFDCSHDTVLPVWIDLRRYNGFDKEGYIKGTARSLFAMSGIQMESISQKVCYLLDGLNEVPTQYIQLCLSEIASITTDYVVITSRPFGSKPKNFEMYNIHPLTSDEIMSIACLFFENHTQLIDFQKKYDVLNASVKETMSKPLFLKLILLIFKETGNIPSQMSIVMRDFFKWLFSQWEPGKIPSDIPSVLKDMVAQKIAFSMQKSGKLVLKTTEALRFAGEVCVDWSTMQIMRPGTFDGISILEALYQHGILENDGEDVIFYHQSFQEYYAAKELYRLLTEGPNVYKKYLLLKNWTSIVSFMPGIADDIEEIVKYLICYPRYDKSFDLAIHIAYQEEFGQNIRKIIDDQLEYMFFCDDIDDRDDYQREAVGALEEITRYTNLTHREINIIKCALSVNMVIGTKERLNDLLNTAS